MYLMHYPCGKGCVAEQKHARGRIFTTDTLARCIALQFYLHMEKQEKNTRQYDTSIGGLVFLEKIGQKENGGLKKPFRVEMR